MARQPLTASQKARVRILRWIMLCPNGKAKAILKEMDYLEGYSSSMHVFMSGAPFIGYDVGHVLSIPEWAGPKALLHEALHVLMRHGERRQRFCEEANEAFHAGAELEINAHIEARHGGVWRPSWRHHVERSAESWAIRLLRATRRSV